MTDAIVVENLSKQYIIRHQTREKYTALRDVLANGAKQFVRKLAHPFAKRENDATRETFWALKDLSFTIKQGDRVGIIGRNGAGKSTLLKILSRITEPSSGRIKIRGRVSSLLEVGTGFHPELTGRENIFLNGAILGMGKAEITRKFDEIVAFAEVEKFLDTPVKRYSSGMYVRLAFAVAAHLEPEILIVDEVLAVGDAQFQKKCLGKMEEVGKEGRTVLFVSHNMGVISQLCMTCVWLDKGQIRDIGRTESVVNAYMLNGQSSLSSERAFSDDPKKLAQLKRISLLDSKGNVVQKFDCDSSINIKLEIHVRKQLPGLRGYLGINKPDGTQVLMSDSFDAATGTALDSLPVGMNTVVVTIPPRTLGHGEYMVHIGLTSRLADNFYVDSPGTVCGFTLDDFTSQRGNRRAGFFSTLLPWQRIEI
ncbi:MAG: ABC transporter ATP-binding protein [Nitrospira sp.]|nr:ABC transporter ATP-binding protein [Nitrospira sp.]